MGKNKEKISYRKFIAEAIIRIEDSSKEKESMNKIVIYSTIAVIMILGLIALAVWKLSVFCIVFALLTVLAVIIAVFRDRIIIKRFCRIADAHRYFRIIEADAETIKALYENSALTYVAEPDDELLDFIYNWLAYEKVLKDETVDLYTFDGKALKSALNKKRINDKMTFLCIFNKDLNFTDNYARNHLYAGARWLDDMC